MADGLLDRLRQGLPTFMLGVRGSRTPEVARIAAATGHHALLVDLEHSAMSVDVAAQISAAAGDLGLFAFVRIPERDHGVIGRVLHGGAHGIIAPSVETVAEADAVARACRGAGAIVQILLETPAGVAEADAIAAVDGVDMLAIGANDLTAALGAPGDYRHPGLREAVATAADACRRHGRLFMLGGVRDRGVRDELAALGACSLELTGMDSDLLAGAARARVEALSA